MISIWFYNNSDQHGNDNSLKTAHLPPSNKRDNFRHVLEIITGLLPNLSQAGLA